MGVAPVRVRKDVYQLPSGDKTLEWYGKAVAEMKKKPLNNPTSWRYQAAIHGYIRSTDPLKKSSDVLPSTADQAKFWNQCQHGSWFFIPWHRGYLRYFERICLGHIVALGGPADWALPYWNYSASGTPNRKLLPPAFRPATVNNQPNPLFVAQRNANSAGNSGITSADVSLQCVTEADFIGAINGGSSGFGGPQTGFSHGGGLIGELEATPHGNIHVRVGGASGWMSQFETAALDPIFWLHHCNIDRLWEVWRGRPGSHGNPTQSTWLNTLFNIHDETGAAVTFKSSAMVSTTALGYQYQDVSDPLSSVPSHLTMGVSAEEPAMTQPPSPPKPAVLAGATDTSVPLGQTRTSARLTVAPAPAARALTSGAQKRVFLNIENITGDGPPGIYAVYVNVPEGEDPEQHPDNLAGTLPLFGLAAASRAEGTHGGSGLTRVLEITKLARRLQGENRWNDQDLDVVFEPSQPVPEGSNVKIGRVSVYYG